MSLKILKNIGILSRLRHFFPRGHFKDNILFFSFVNPYFLYCVSVWASTFPSTFKPLQILQNKVPRLIFNINNISSVSHLYGSSGFFSVHQHHFIGISNICLNYVFGQLSLNFLEYSRQIHNSTITQHLIVLISLLKLGQRCDRDLVCVILVQKFGI